EGGLELAEGGGEGGHGRTLPRAPGIGYKVARMDDERLELVRVDATGTAHPVGKTASQRMRARQGASALSPAPPHLIVMRYVGEDGRRDPEDGPVFRLAGEITTPGAICDVFALIGQAGWKGELVILDGNQSRSIFFDQSAVVAATSTVE